MFEREDGTQRFYVEAGPADDAAVELGFGWLVTYSEAHDFDQAGLVVPQLRSLDSLARVLGPGVAGHFRKHRRFVLGGFAISLYTESKLPYAFEAGPILAIWTRDKSLDKLDVLGAPAICAVPWTPDNIADWKQNWNPTDLRSGQSGGTTETVQNPVVREALEDLTATVNVGTGLSHPSDRASAVQMFKLLRDGSEPYRADEIRAWAVRNGWAPEDARELADIAQKVLDRRAVRAGETMWRPDTLARWREEAEARRHP